MSASTWKSIAKHSRSHTTFDAISTVKAGQMVSVKGKVMTKSGVKMKGICPWAYADIKDDEMGNTLRIRAEFKQAKVISDLTFLGTYEFHGFLCTESQDGRSMCVTCYGSAIRTADEQLDDEFNWDETEYFPLSFFQTFMASSDIRTEQDMQFTIDWAFIVKLVKKEDRGDMLVVDFKDEGQTLQRFRVSRAYADQLIQDRIFVLHRAIQDETTSSSIGVVNQDSMLATAPRSYMW